MTPRFGRGLAGLIHIFVIRASTPLVDSDRQRRQTRAVKSSHCRRAPQSNPPDAPARERRIPLHTEAGVASTVGGTAVRLMTAPCPVGDGDAARVSGRSGRGNQSRGADAGRIEAGSSAIAASDRNGYALRGHAVASGPGHDHCAPQQASADVAARVRPLPIFPSRFHVATHPTAFSFFYPGKC